MTETIIADDPADDLTHDTVEAFAQNVSLDEYDDDTLDRIDEAVNELLTGDLNKFPSDDAFDAAIELSQRLDDEFDARDPATDDPYYMPADTAERYNLPICSVEVQNVGHAENIVPRIRVTLDESHLDSEDETSVWDFRADSELAAIAADYYGVEDPLALGVAIGKPLPVVGATAYTWSRVDRYALENDGETAIQP